ncbi:MAG: hypothetical protein WC356_02845 [Candidatus Micrarchaeia archaeon]
MAKCKHCGKCCLSGVPCSFSQILFDITEKNPRACPACTKKAGLFWCDILLNPEKWFASMVGEVEWKCEAMADVARIYIGIGDGCGRNPAIAKIAKCLKIKFNPRERLKNETDKI